MALTHDIMLLRGLAQLLHQWTEWIQHLFGLESTSILIVKSSIWHNSRNGKWHNNMRIHKWYIQFHSCHVETKELPWNNVSFVFLGSKLLINKYKIWARFYLPESQHGLNKAIGTGDKLTMWEWSVLAL